MAGRATRHLVAFGIATCAALGGLGVPAALADSSVTVSSQCTLSDAVGYATTGTANANCPVTQQGGSSPGTVTINVPAGDYKLSATLAITSSDAAIVSIVGAGPSASGTIIDGQNSVEPIHIGASTQVTLQGLQVTNGSSGQTDTGESAGDAIDGNVGGGIANLGSLTLEDDLIADNATGSGGVYCGCGSSSSGGSGGNGGGIYSSGSLTIVDSTITGNLTGAGGAGTASAAQATPADGGDGGEAGAGGGIFAAGPLTITDSTISGNATGSGGAGGAGSAGSGHGDTGGEGGFGGEGGGGGGIWSDDTVAISDSTINANATGAGGTGGGGGAGDSAADGLNGDGGDGGSGGGIVLEDGTASVDNTTIEGNVTGAAGADGSGGSGDGGSGEGGNGGGVQETTQSSDEALQQDTVADNAAAGVGGGLSAHLQFAVDQPSLTVDNSIIASNTAGGAPENCAGTVTGDTSGSGASTDIDWGDSNSPDCPGSTTADPKLEPLADYGGPTDTMALGAGSAAIDFDPTDLCPIDTDQRGIGRPQPGDGGCDAGAYEHALPTIASPSATSSAPSTGTVSAQINPEFSGQATRVVVNYGKSTAYGLSTTAQSIGDGDSSVAFSASLSGLAPDTTYHYEVVATNGDGTSTSADRTFVTRAGDSVAVSKAVQAGSKLKLTLACTGGTVSSTCSGPIKLTARATKRGRTRAGRTDESFAVGSDTTDESFAVGSDTTDETVGSGSYSLVTGHSETVTVALDATGRRLLDQSYKLPVTVTVGAVTPTTRTFTFVYPRIRTRITYRATFPSHCCGSDAILDVAFKGIPKGAKVQMRCGHGACSPRHTTFNPKGSNLSLGRSHVVVKLPRHAVADLEVTLPNHVGRVLQITNPGAGRPTSAFRCLPPGASAPSKCV